MIRVDNKAIYLPDFLRLRRMAGLVMYLAGKFRKEYHLENLGWYMLGTGLDKRLPARYNDLVLHLRGITDKWGWATVSSVYVNAYDIDDEDTYHSEYDDTQLEAENAEWAVDFHMSLGKFRVRCVDNMIELEDLYLFYPTCMKCAEHDHTCTCSNKHWAEVEYVYHFENPMIYKLMSKIAQRARAAGFEHEEWDLRFIIEHEYKGDVLILVIYGIIDDDNKCVSLRLVGLDQVFAGLGKPYYTRARIKKGE